MKQNTLDTMHIILAIIFAMVLIYDIGCTNVKSNQFSAGKILQDTTIKTPDSETIEEADIVKYAQLPDWQLYDLNPTLFGILLFIDLAILYFIIQHLLN